MPGIVPSASCMLAYAVCALRRTVLAQLMEKLKLREVKSLVCHTASSEQRDMTEFGARNQFHS